MNDPGSYERHKARAEALGQAKRKRRNLPALAAEIAKAAKAQRLARRFPKRLGG